MIIMKIVIIITMMITEGPAAFHDGARDFRGFDPGLDPCKILIKYE